MKLNTKVEHQVGDATVSLFDVHCTSYGPATEAHSLGSTKVDIAFSKPSGETSQFFSWPDGIDFVGQQRWISRIKCRTCVRLFRQAGGVHTEQVVMAESDITTVRDVENGQFRLIITSHDGRVILSQKHKQGYGHCISPVRVLIHS